MNPLANTIAVKSIPGDRYGTSLADEAHIERILAMIRSGDLVVLSNEAGQFYVTTPAMLTSVRTNPALDGYAPQVDTNAVEETLRAHARQLMGIWN
jgi:hypothetical protein